MKKLWFKAKPNQSDSVARPHKVWFREKTYGWGWTPVTWQGWFVLLVYSALLALSIMRFEINLLAGGRAVAEFLLEIFIITGALIFICSKTGETPK